MSAIHKRGPARFQANLTPMIDVTFLLIVFFVLVSQIVEVENVDLALPALDEPASDLPGTEQRSVINIVPGPAGGAAEYRLGAQSFPADPGGLELLTRELAAVFRVNPAQRVNLRADQQTHYTWIHPVLRAVSAAAARVDAMPAAPRVNLVVTRED